MCNCLNSIIGTCKYTSYRIRFVCTCLVRTKYSWYFNMENFKWLLQIHTLPYLRPPHIMSVFSSILVVSFTDTYPMFMHTQNKNNFELFVIATRRGSRRVCGAVIDTRTCFLRLECL